MTPSRPPRARPYRRGPYRLPVRPCVPVQEHLRIETTGHEDGERGFETWLWFKLDPAARRELVAALTGLLRREGGRIVNTRWGRPLSSRGFEVTVVRHVRNGRPSVNLSARVYCIKAAQDTIVLVSGWDPTFEPQMSRLRALAELRRVAEGGAVTPGVNRSAGRTFDTGTHTGTDAVGIRGFKSRERPPDHWNCAEDGLARIAERVANEAAREGADLDAAFWARCERYRLSCDVRQARCRMGLTQGELARIAAVRRTDVSLLESAHDGVSLANLFKLVGSLNELSSALVDLG